MKKNIIKFLSLITIILLVFEIYVYGKSNKLYYVTLGDSLSAGLNSYGKVEYGYNDYIKDYLTNKNHLSYYKNYAKSGYETINIIEDINNNLNLKKDLRESDLVTISIGANDLLNKIDFKNFEIDRILELKNQVKNIVPNLDKCIKEIRKYAKEKIIIIGYYNPIPFLFNTNEKDLDDLFAYIDDEYIKLAKKYGCTYHSFYQSFKKHNNYLPNPSDIHPNFEGYKDIANRIIKKEKI